ncbi:MULTISPECIES: S-layer homology domain-containing protein [unclassified Bacillus cereus group]|uniref:S-layer homology domain-containing protein n=1 Tax=unclassified Bacillus cereus group TaxID=2750818 RepID=UPI002412B156|nr:MULTISPECIES: S-layer homology domain-containing protein [unclassified Bacillus cereus group]
MTKNKSYNKVVAGTMATAMVAGVVTPVAAAGKTFPDVPSWAANSVNYLVEKGAINGKPDGTFAPTENIDRASAAKIMAISLGLEIDKEAKPSFKDAQDNWATPYIAAVEKAGVIVGDGSGLFKPNDKITRAAMASMLVKAYKLEGKVANPETKFHDLEDHWGAHYANILVALEISNGTDNGWAPDKDVTRAEAAKFIAVTDMKYGKKQEKEAKVEAVNVLNAKQVEVKFTQSVDVQTVAKENETLKDTVVFSAIGDAKAINLDKAKAQLSEDGKILTVTAGENEIFVGKYATTIIGVKTIDGKEVTSHASFFTSNDTTRPVVSGVDYTDNNTAKIKFSEPLKELGTVTTDNQNVTSEDVKFKAGNDFATIDLSKVTGEGTVPVKVTLVGTKDFTGNFITPNPAQVTVEKKEDKVAPEVKGVQVISDTQIKVTYSEKIKAATVKINGNTVTGTPDAEGLVYTYTANFKDGVNKLDITSLTDLVGNTGKSYSKQFVVSTDKVAPTVVNNKIVTEHGKEVLVVTYSEPVTVSNREAQRFHGTFMKDYVTADGSFMATPVVDSKDNKVVKIPVTEASKGNWTITLPKGFVTDQSQAKNQSPEKSIEFVRAGDEVAPTKLTTSVSENKNVITVTFNGKVDGATAIKAENYKLEGAAVEKAVLKSNEEKAAAVELTLKEGSVKATGDYQLTVSGIKSAAGVDVDKVTKSVQLDENIAPVMQKVELVNGQEIVLTFSENLLPASVVEKNPVADYAVFIEGVQIDAAKVTEAMGEKNNQIKLTLTDELNSDQLAKAITIKPTDHYEVLDLVGNKAATFEKFNVAKVIK